MKTMFTASLLAVSLLAVAMPASAQTVQTCGFTYDRDCYPTHEDAAFYCVSSPIYPSGGIVGATVVYVIGTAFIVCNGSGDLAGWMAETGGDAAFAAAQEAGAAAGFTVNDVVPAAVAYGSDVALILQGEASDQAVMACNFILGPNACIGYGGTAPSDCLHLQGNGGVVGMTINYLDAAGDSACGAVDAGQDATLILLRHATADTRVYVQEADARLDDATAELSEDAYATADSAGDTAEAQSDWTCTYLVGTPCPTIYIQMVRAAANV